MTLHLAPASGTPLCLHVCSPSSHSQHHTFQVKFSGFTGQGLATLSWSLARMDVKPKGMWLLDFLQHSQRCLPALARHRRDQPFTNIIWALACWDAEVPAVWLQEFCRCVVLVVGVL